MRRNLHETDLTLEDRCAARRHYRILRIAIYGDIAYTGWDRPALQGCYGLERDEAKKRIRDFYGDVSWNTYLGSK